MTPRDVRLSPDQQSGKAAFKALVRAFGGQDAAAEDYGIGQPRLSEMGSPNVPVFPTLDLIDHLEARTVGTPGHPHITNWLARRRGFALVALPSSDDDGAALMVKFAHVGAEFGDVSHRLTEAMADGQMSPSEAGNIRQELTELMERAAAMIASVDVLISGGR